MPTQKPVPTLEEAAAMLEEFASKRGGTVVKGPWVPTTRRPTERHPEPRVAYYANIELDGSKMYNTESFGGGSNVLYRGKRQCAYRTDLGRWMIIALR